MKKIILDTNALMAITSFNIPLFRELQECCDFNYHLYILEGTKYELEKIIKEQRGKFQRAAKLALTILKAKKIKIIPSSGHVDDLLVEHSIKGDFILTQDLALKKRLAKPYLTIRQKKKVMMIK